MDHTCNWRCRTQTWWPSKQKQKKNKTKPEGLSSNTVFISDTGSEKMRGTNWYQHRHSHHHPLYNVQQKKGWVHVGDAGHAFPIWSFSVRCFCTGVLLRRRKHDGSACHLGFQVANLNFKSDVEGPSVGRVWPRS